MLISTAMALRLDKSLPLHQRAKESMHRRECASLQSSITRKAGSSPPGSIMAPTNDRMDLGSVGVHPLKRADEASEVDDPLLHAMR